MTSQPEEVRSEPGPAPGTLEAQGSQPKSAPLEGFELGKSILLSSRSTEDKLRMITAADCLGLYPMGAARANEVAYLVEPTRLFEEALLRVVYEQPPRGDFEAWLIGRIDDAMLAIMRVDRQLLGTGEPGNPLHYENLVSAFLVPPERAMEASVRFNGLGPRARQAFFRMLIDDPPMSVPEALEAGFGPIEQLQRELQAAASAVRCDLPPLGKPSDTLGGRK